MRLRPDPLVIGASGGSGTRVFAKLARQAGFFMGRSLNRSEDSAPFVDFYDAWTPLYLKREGRLSDQERRAVDEDFACALRRHLTGLPHAEVPWGVKSPRSLLFLAFWARHYPRMRFLHVVRHGGDMASSGNQREFQMYRALLLTRQERQRFRQTREIAYWCKANLPAAAFGARRLKDRYLMVRFEDLCREPSQEIARIFQWLEVSDARRVEAAAAEVAPPSTIGRWQRAPLGQVHALLKNGRPGLERFGYWDGEAWGELDRAMRGPRWRRWWFRCRHVMVSR